MKRESKYILIIVILLFLILLTVFKFKIYPNLKANVGIFNKANFNDYIYEKNSTDEDEYSSLVPEYKRIIIFEITNLDDNNKKTKIKLEIKDDKKVYVTINNDTKKLSDTSFLSLLWYQEGYSVAKIYLLDVDNNIYLLENISENINDISINKIDTLMNIKNFTKAKIKTDIYLTSDLLFLLNNDGNFYNLSNNLRYDKDIISLYDLFYVMPNNEIVTKDNKSIVIDNEKIKIRYCFLVYSNNFVAKNSKIIITTDDRLVYYDFDKKEYYYLDAKVKELSFKEYIPYIKSNLKIWFDNGKKVEFTAACNQYFCVNN